MAEQRARSRAARACRSRGPSSRPCRRGSASATPSRRGRPRARRLSLDLLDLDGDRVRHLLLRQPQRLLADELGDLHLERQVGALLAREVERPLRQQRDELVAQLADAVAGLRAHRMQRVEVAERRGRSSSASAMWPGFSRSTLFSAITTGTPSAKTRWRRSGRRRRSARGRRGRSSDGVDVLERRVDRALHPLGQRVERPLEARAGRRGRAGSPSPFAIAADPAPRRLRLVGDDRDLAAAERVDERRLADVRPAGDGDEAGLHAAGPSVSGQQLGRRCT